MDSQSQLNHLLQPDGTSQQQRLLPWLKPESILLDERRLQELLDYSYKLAAVIQYYTPGNSTEDSNQNKLDWRAFFDAFHEGTEPDKQVLAEALIQKELQSREDIEPHFALFLCFLELFKVAQVDLNTLTERHLDHYYKEVLQLKTKSAEADHVHLVLELAKKFKEHKVDENTAIDGGKDEAGNALTYHTTDEIVINPAQITELKSVFVDRAEHIASGAENPISQSRIFKAPQANSADGQGAELDTDEPKWYAFGTDQIPAQSTIQADSPKNMIPAKVGFAIASPQLLLGEGDRHICISLNFSQTDADKEIVLAIDKLEKTLDILNGNIGSRTLDEDFEVWLSGEEGWFAPFTVSIKPDECKDFEVPDPPIIPSSQRQLSQPQKLLTQPQGLGGPPLSSSLGGKTKFVFMNVLKPSVPGFTARSLGSIGQGATPPADGSLSLQIIMKLTPEMPAVVPYDDEIILEGFSTNWPMVKILLKEDANSYDLLSKLDLKSVNIRVDAYDIKNLIIQNDTSLLDPSSTFLPFGPQPKLLNHFYIGNAEVFQKKISKLNLKLTWEDPPSDFHEYYEVYDDAIDFDYFKASFQVLSDKKWLPAGSSDKILKNLFELDATTRQTKISNTLHIDLEKSFTPIPDRNPNNDKLSPLSTGTLRGFARLTLEDSFDENNPLYYIGELPSQAAITDKNNMTLEVGQMPSSYLKASNFDGLPERPLGTNERVYYLGEIPQEENISGSIQVKSLAPNYFGSNADLSTLTRGTALNEEEVYYVGLIPSLTTLVKINGTSLRINQLSSKFVNGSEYDGLPFRDAEKDEKIFYLGELDPSISLTKKDGSSELVSGLGPNYFASSRDFAALPVESLQSLGQVIYLGNLADSTPLTPTSGSVKLVSQLNSLFIKASDYVGIPNFPSSQDEKTFYIGALNPSYRLTQTSASGGTTQVTVQALGPNFFINSSDFKGLPTESLNTLGQVYFLGNLPGNTSLRRSSGGNITLNNLNSLFAKASDYQDFPNDPDNSNDNLFYVGDLNGSTELTKKDNNKVEVKDLSPNYLVSTKDFGALPTANLSTLGQVFYVGDLDPSIQLTYNNNSTVRRRQLSSDFIDAAEFKYIPNDLNRPDDNIYYVGDLNPFTFLTKLGGARITVGSLGPEVFIKASEYLMIPSAAIKIPKVHSIPHVPSVPTVQAVPRVPTVTPLLKSETSFEAFGHKQFPNLYTQKAIKHAKDVQDEVANPTVLPNTPYTPALQEISLDYTSSETIELSTLSDKPEQVFAITPFGHIERTPAMAAKNEAFLLPQFDGQGNFYVGIENFAPPRTISILFQIAEGSAAVDSIATTADILKPEDIQWSYLKGEAWEPFPGINIVRDSTEGLQRSGIITFSVPSAATKEHTRMPSGKHWLKATIQDRIERANQFINVHTQAVKATLDLPAENAAQIKLEDHLAQGLEPEKVKGLIVKDALVKAVTQPYSSFDGRTAEASEHFYTRISERLRHKQRAWACWDYEHLVLERFPSAYKVKCLNYLNFEDIKRSIELARETASEDTGICVPEPVDDSPGHVTVVVVSNIRNQNLVNPLEPKTSLTKLYEIEQYFKGIMSRQVTIHAVNPTFERIKIDLDVAFKAGFDPGYYKSFLNDELRHFLSPWAFEEGQDIVFSNSIYKSDILSFIESRNYVDHVLKLRLFHYFDENLVLLGGIGYMVINDTFVVEDVSDSDQDSKDIDKITAVWPTSILVSHSEHKINHIEDVSKEDCEGVAALGICTMAIGKTFILDDS